MKKLNVLAVIALLGMPLIANAATTFDTSQLTITGTVLSPPACSFVGLPTIDLGNIERYSFSEQKVKSTIIINCDSGVTGDILQGESNSLFDIPLSVSGSIKAELFSDENCSSPGSVWGTGGIGFTGTGNDQTINICLKLKTMTNDAVGTANHTIPLTLMLP